MSERNFKVDFWLQNNKKKDQAKSITSKDRHYQNHNCQDFQPHNFLIPGWKGESLPSKSGVMLQKSLFALWEDALNQFKGLQNKNKSFQITIWQEFLSFSQVIELECPELDNYSSFWRHIEDEHSPYSRILSHFKKIYCFRAVTIYIFKIRFITTLFEEIEKIGPPLIKLMNPNYTLEQIFKKGGQWELSCESLQANNYSWYRPSH